MNTIEQPKGIVIMDTCCFLDYIEGNNRYFNYEKIIQYIKDHKYWLVITSYTLYEVVQSILSVAQLRERRTQLLDSCDFWVLDINYIMGVNGFEFGKDFLFLLHMHTDEKFREFITERTKLREKVYKTLYQKIYLFSQLVASVYLIITDSDSEGRIGQELGLQLHLIDNFFEHRKERYDMLFSELYSHSEGFYYYNPDKKRLCKGKDSKYLLGKMVFDQIIQILAVTKVERRIIVNNEGEIGLCEFNKRVTETYYEVKQSMENQRFSKLMKQHMQKTKNIANIDSIADHLLINFKYPLQKEAFKLLLHRVFDSNGFGKTFSNDFIDMTNLCIVEHFRLGFAAYLTVDKAWQEFIFDNQKNPHTKASLYFYNNFLL